MKTVVAVLCVEHPFPEVTVWGASLSYDGRTKFFSGSVGNSDRADYFAAQRVMSMISEAVSIELQTNAMFDESQSRDLAESLWMHRLHVKAGLALENIPLAMQDLMVKEAEHAKSVLTCNFEVVVESLRVFGMKEQYLVFRGDVGEVFYWAAGIENGVEREADLPEVATQPCLFV